MLPSPMQYSLFRLAAGTKLSSQSLRRSAAEVSSRSARLGPKRLCTARMRARVRHTSKGRACLNGFYKHTNETSRKTHARYPFGIPEPTRPRLSVWSHSCSNALYLITDSHFLREQIPPRFGRPRSRTSAPYWILQVQESELIPFGFELRSPTDPEHRG